MTTTEDPGVGMTPEIADKLMEPFSRQEIGLLPRVTCKKCSDPRKFGDCDQHRKERCAQTPSCGSWISTQHIHIDYVGHADVTARLLRVDPSWTWEPLGEDDAGLPVFDRDSDGRPVGLWIRLTVAGVTRLGYGSVPSGQNDAVKVLIGDALRNSALRFGVAWDLWAKGDRTDPTAENATASAGTAEQRRPPRQNGKGRTSNGAAKQDQPAPSELDDAKSSLRWACANNGWDLKRVADVFATQHGVSLRDTDRAEDVRAFLAALAADAEHVLGQSAPEGATT